MGSGRLVAGLVLCVAPILWTAKLGAQGVPSASRFRLVETTIDEVHAALKDGLSCRALVAMYLERVAAYDKAGPRLNAVQSINSHALDEAERLDAAFRTSGPTGPLHCIPVLVKDQLETRDMPTTYGSAVFKDFVPLRDATVVTKLRTAGAVILGKTTMGEFASRYVGSAFGIVRNAYDPDRTAGGSSGGTGAAIAANFATVGIGEDTGGSVRGPASVGSLVGLRPTVPLVSRFGMLPAKPSSDTIGPMSRTVRDAALLLDVLAGYDPNDPVTAYSVGHVPRSYTEFLSKDGLKGARIGVIREPMDARTEPASDDYRKVRTVIDAAISDLRRLGATIVDPITIPDLKQRIRRGFDENQFETEPAIDRYLAEHPNAPVKTVREILLTGKVVPWRAVNLIETVGHSTDEPGYLKVLHAAEDTRRVVLGLMAEHRLDALAYATFDHQPTLIASDVLTNPRTVDRYNIGNNRYFSAILGFPAITVPAGFTTDGLPVGLELLGRAFSEGMLFKLAYGYEQGTFRRKPPAATPPLANRNSP